MTGLLVLGVAAYLFLAFYVYVSARTPGLHPPMPRAFAILAALSWPILAVIGAVFALLERTRR